MRRGVYEISVKGRGAYLGGRNLCKNTKEIKGGMPPGGE